MIQQTNERAKHAITTLEAVTTDVRTAFGGLSAEELNQRPADGGWSVAQCLDHLITINTLYFPLLDSMRVGPPTPSAWERFSPLSGLFGRLLTKSLSPDSKRKVKTTRKAQPSASTIDAGIIDRFTEHQDALIERVRGIAPTVNHETTIVTSPLAALVTYSLADCLTLLAVHEQRHLAQAKRVLMLA